MANQTPLIIMMTTTTTTTSVGQKKHRRDLDSSEPPKLSKNEAQFKNNQSQTELVPYYDFLTDISDGYPINSYGNYHDVLGKLNELIIEQDIPSRLNDSTDFKSDVEVDVNFEKNIKKINDLTRRMYLNDFWLEEEKELTCCKHLVCEMEQFLSNRSYTDYISRAIGMSCGLNEEDTIGFGSCSDVKKICEENGQQYFSFIVKNSHTNLLSHMMP